MSKLDDLLAFFQAAPASYERCLPLPRAGFPGATDCVACTIEVLALCDEVEQLRESNHDLVAENARIIGQLPAARRMEKP